MDLKAYVDLVMQNIQDSGYYSEIKERELRFIIEKYIRNEYNDKVALLNLQIDAEQARGEMKDMEFYRNKLIEIKSYVVTLTRELGKVTKY